jgi:4-amino-4-deoxy-L-arabinose transferase-like glycosyltransferase
VKSAKTFNFILVPLPIILLLGFILRLAWMIAQTPVISIDGTEYVRMAENLVLGNGLVGLYGEPETMYAPLFPFLITGVAMVVPNAETAAHLVLLLFGTILILEVFLLARLIYGQRVAYICALLTAGHPLLVKLTATIYNETIYMALLMPAVYFGLQALELRKIRDYALCGLCFGLAYLARPEAAAYPLFFSLALCIAGYAQKKFKLALLASAIVIGAFTIVASPYVAYLYKETGSLRLEGKWNINYTDAQRLMAGMNFEEAAFGIDKDLNAEGPLLQPRKFANYTPYPHGLKDKLHVLFVNAKRNAWIIYYYFVDDAIGSPVLLILAVLGLFRSPWSHRRLWQEAIMLAMTISIIFLLLTATETNYRYFFPILAFLLIWASKGVEELGAWARDSSAFTNNLLPRPITLVRSLQACAVALVFGLSVIGTGSALQTDAAVAARDAGKWLRAYRPGPKVVAAWVSVVPFYADGTYVEWPYANPELTLRYLMSTHDEIGNR